MYWPRELKEDSNHVNSSLMSLQNSPNWPVVGLFGLDFGIQNGIQIAFGVNWDSVWVWEFKGTKMMQTALELVNEASGDEFLNF